HGRYAPGDVLHRHARRAPPRRAAVRPVAGARRACGLPDPAGLRGLAVRPAAAGSALGRAAAGPAPARPPGPYGPRAPAALPRPRDHLTGSARRDRCRLTTAGSPRRPRSPLPGAPGIGRTPSCRRTPSPEPPAPRAVPDPGSREGHQVITPALPRSRDESTDQAITAWALAARTGDPVAV